MGVLPETQFGDVSTVTTDALASSNQLPLTLTIPEETVIGELFARYRTDSGMFLGNLQGDDDYTIYSNDASAQSGDKLVVGNSSSGSKITSNVIINSDVFDSIRTSFSILQLRRAEAEQRWKEISQSGDYDYRDQVYKHFGVKLSPALSNLAIWHGGISRNLDISEVVNTNLESDESAATIHGKGVGSGDGYFEFTTNEHSVVMIIYHAEPVLDYALNGPTGQLWATDATDIPIPEFDNIGMESVHLEQFFNSSSLDTIIANPDSQALYLGYQPRYYPWKTKLDIVNGAFTSTLRTWVSAYSMEDFLRALVYRFVNSQDDQVPSTNPVAWSRLMNYNIFRINPHILDDIFIKYADSTWDTDQLLVNSHFDVKLVENLSRDGLPY